MSTANSDFATSLRSAQNTNSLNANDSESFIWGMLEVLAKATDSGLDPAIQVMAFLRQVDSSAEAEADYNAGLVPNPYFVINRYSGKSPESLRYLRNSSMLNLGGAAIGLAGTGLSQVTQVDPLGAIRAGNAMRTTRKHMVKLREIRRGHQLSNTVGQWVRAMNYAKSVKLGIRGANLAGAVIPCGSVGLAASTVTTLASVGVKLTLGKLIARTAIEVHWRAHVEARVSEHIFAGSGGKAVGPASKMMHEIFTQRGLTKYIAHKKDVGAMIMEPSGWLALNDKLMLM